MNRSLVKFAPTLLALSLMGCSDSGSAQFAGQQPQSNVVTAATVFANPKEVVKTPASVVSFTEPDGTQVVAGSNQLLVAFDEEITDADLDAALQAIQGAGGAVVGGIPAILQIQVEFPDGSDLVALQQQFQALPGVVDVSLNEVLADEQGPAPVYPVPATFDGSWWVDSINAPAAWGYLKLNGTFPLVGVADSGFNLSANVIDPGRIQARWDSEGTPLTDTDTDGTNPHGTKVVSFALGDARSGSAFPTVGVNWGSKVLVVQARGDSDSGFVFNGRAAVTTAITEGARFVNFSAGPVVPRPAKSENQFYQSRQRFRAGWSNVLELASQRDAVLTFSAGNDGEGQNLFTVKSDNQFLPTGSRDDSTVWSTHALIVGANDSSNAMSSFSREGTVVALSAPGEDIGFGKELAGSDTFRGTSYAAPIAMGACSALLNVNPDLMACEARAVVLQTLSNNIASLAGQLKQLNFGAAAQMAAGMPARDTNPVVLRLSASQWSTQTVILVNSAGIAQNLSLKTIGDADNLTSISPAQYTAVPSGESRSFQATFQRGSKVSGRTITQRFMLWGVAGQSTVIYRLPATITLLADD